MLRLAVRTKHLLLGTATPIQTEVHELWDLIRVLNAGADFVLGRELYGRWVNWEKSLPVVKGKEFPADEGDAWEWLRNPLPPAEEDALFATLRLQLGLPDQNFFTDRGFGSLGFLEQQAIGQALEPGFLREHNPIVRHTVLRRRQTLEDAELLERIGVNIHPDPSAPATAYPGVGFSGLGLMTTHPSDLAYSPTPVNFTGRERYATAINGSVPAPVLRWREGDTVTLRVTNNLSEDTSIHWHGIILPSTQDGVPHVSDGFGGIRPGELFTYRITTSASAPWARPWRVSGTRAGTAIWPSGPCGIRCACRIGTSPT